MNPTAKLYGADAKLFREIELPASLKNCLPEVIFYGNKAFHSVLVKNGNYTECSCYRAAEEQVFEEGGQVAS